MQMTGKDKDYRYMATSDLLNELNRENFKPDTDLEIKLSTIVLQQLDDVAGDVSGLAVKWYAFLYTIMIFRLFLCIEMNICELVIMVNWFCMAYIYGCTRMLKFFIW